MKGGGRASSDEGGVIGIDLGIDINLQKANDGFIYSSHILIWEVFEYNLYIR